ncbi:hypothetical protein Tco_0881175 [Tanacetum coccineum]
MMVRCWCGSGWGDDVDGGCDDVVVLARQVAAAILVLRLRGDGSRNSTSQQEISKKSQGQGFCDNRDLSRLKWFTYVHDVIFEVNDYLILCAYELGVKYSICSHVVIMEMKDVLHALLRQFLVFKS